MTGIELALAAAGLLATQFLRGYLRGLRAGALEHGVDPDALGERFGRWTIDQLVDRATALAERAAALLHADANEMREQSNPIGEEVQELLDATRTGEAALPSTAGDRGRTEGHDELVAALVENGFDSERANMLAPRLAARLAHASVRVPGA